MEFKGTKGEWRIEDKLGDETSYLILDKIGYEVCVADSEFIKDIDEVIANAKLIAAAPDLLEALQLVTDELFQAIECINSVESAKSSTNIKIAEKAINKALN